MVGAKTLVGVMDVDVIVGNEEIALAALGTLGRKLGDAALGNGRADLLRGGGIRARKNQDEKKQRYRWK